MFNLLPPEQKKSIRREYHLRLATVVFSFLSFTGLVLLAFLLPSFFKINISYSDLARQKNQLEEKTPELKDVEMLTKTVSETMKKLRILETGLDNAALSVVIEKIISIQPSGLEIKNLSFSLKEQESKVKLTGQANTRNLLLDFVKKLGEDELFSSVDLPVSDLAKDREVKFSVSFNVNI